MKLDHVDGNLNNTFLFFLFAVLPLFTVVQWGPGSCSAASGEIGYRIGFSFIILKLIILYSI